MISSTRRTAFALSLLTIAAVLCATRTALSQATSFVTPISATKTEGNAWNLFPFHSQTKRRYMQIHSDLPMQAIKVTTIGFRVEAESASYKGTRTLDIELYMGQSVPYDRCSFYYDRNWLPGTKTLVVKRKKVSFGPGTPKFPGPSPFNKALQIKLDAPYTRLPPRSFAWELVVHGNTGGGIGKATDAEASNFVVGKTTSYGQGCTATGQRAPMSHSAELFDVGGTVILRAIATNCPKNSPAFLILGARNPSLAVPGLCTKLLSDLLLLLPIGKSDSSGNLNLFHQLSADGVLLFPNPGSVQLYSQVLSLDTGRSSGFPFALSNGRSFKTPAKSSGTVIRATRLFDNSWSVSSKQSYFFGASTIGFALVIQLS